MKMKPVWSQWLVCTMVSRERTSLKLTIWIERENIKETKQKKKLTEAADFLNEIVEQTNIACPSFSQIDLYFSVSLSFFQFHFFSFLWFKKSFCQAKLCYLVSSQRLSWKWKIFMVIVCHSFERKESSRLGRYFYCLLNNRGNEQAVAKAVPSHIVQMHQFWLYINWKQAHNWITCHWIMDWKI